MNFVQPTPKYKLRLATGQVIKDLVKSEVKTPDDLAVFKRKIAKKYKISCPSNISLLKAYHDLIKRETPYNNKLYTGQGIKKRQRIAALLKTRPVRSLSGIINVSVLTKSYPCPGKCIYCPIEKGIPKSYVSGEPAVERAKKLNYDPYLQVKKRIEMLEAEGHPTDKIELRIVGGTWSYYPKKYQEWFVRRCFEACYQQRKITPMGAVLRYNEKAKYRIVGLSIETRPDFINEKEIRHLRSLGVTMVELGVQSIYDDVLKKNLRGHGIKETILATKLLKDAGFKVLYQMMPNLPGSNLKRDEKMFEELFQNPDFQPDLLKIYPCALLKEAPLYKYWQKGKYKPYTNNQLKTLIKKIKKKIPYYVRIQRITRDIPSKSIVAGPAKISNLRQILIEEMKREIWRCKCIRCREVKEKYNPKEKIFLFRQDYEASGGKEIFLSFENKKRDKLCSLLRLRITSKNAAIIREIHTYGTVVPIAEKRIAPQHRGLGKKLIKEAEKIVKREFNNSHVPIRIAEVRAKQGRRRAIRIQKIAVISGVGVRNYFRKLGYKLEDTYMTKKI